MFAQSVLIKCTSLALPMLWLTWSWPVCRNNKSEHSFADVLHNGEHLRVAVQSEQHQQSSHRTSLMPVVWLPKMVYRKYGQLQRERERRDGREGKCKEPKTGPTISEAQVRARTLAERDRQTGMQTDHVDEQADDFSILVHSSFCSNFPHFWLIIPTQVNVLRHCHSSLI